METVDVLGGPEFLIVAVLAGLLFATVYGAYRAFTSGDTGWGTGILLSLVVGLGWLTAIVYLVTVDRRRRAA